MPVCRRWAFRPPVDDRSWKKTAIDRASARLHRERPVQSPPTFERISCRSFAPIKKYLEESTPAHRSSALATRCLPRPRGSSCRSVSRPQQLLPHPRIGKRRGGGAGCLRRRPPTVKRKESRRLKRPRPSPCPPGSGWPRGPSWAPEW